MQELNFSAYKILCQIYTKIYYKKIIKKRNLEIAKNLLDILEDDIIFVKI
jgi:hypothetical protein